MDSFLFYITSAIATLVLVVCLKISNNYSFFRKRGVHYVKPNFLLGSNPRGALMMQPLSESWSKMYDKLKGHKIGGFFHFMKPYFIVLDPEYAYKVMISDFSHFQDRGVKIDEKVNPLDGHLFLLSGQKWRFLRTKLSPIFTSGKLRWMFDEMIKCSDHFVDHIKLIANGDDVDIKEDLSRVTTDMIGSCAFGFDSEALKNPDSQFRSYNRRVFSPSLREGGMFLLKLAVPELLLKLKVKAYADDVTNFYCSAIKQAFAHRLKTGYSRKDFVQLLLELREKGSVQINAEDKEELNKNSFSEFNKMNGNTKTLELDDNILAAQSFVFLVAGFETTASTIHMTSYLLSKNPHVQEKAREEVREVLKKHGSLTYEAVKDMEYLEKCINETLRIYPSAPHTFRECTKDYVFPDGTRIEKGDSIILPIISLQNDPDYFPNPDVYDPSRFDYPLKHGTYFPFGEGPRICIGKRFATIEMKIILAKLLENFSFEKSNKTIEPIRFSPKVILLYPTDNIYVKIKPLCK